MACRQMPTDPLADTRVLVVEEDADLLEAITSALSSICRPTPCRSAHRALALLESGRRFDVLVCGYEMLEMTGRDLHERLAQIDFVLARHSLWIVAGRLSPEDEGYADEARARVLYHPFRLDRLREELRVLAAHAALA
ncbi:MAG: response regulator [Myxococcales bacterium]